MTVRMPRWYVLLCDAQSRAVWLGQVTESEASAFLRVFHGIALREALEAAA